MSSGQEGGCIHELESLFQFQKVNVLLMNGSPRHERDMLDVEAVKMISNNV
jgi:hypothetical protein